MREVRTVEKKQEYWGALAAGYMFLAALGAMMFLVAAVLDLSGSSLVERINGWACLAAVVVTAIGAMFLTVELGDKTKFYLVMMKPSSIMSFGSIVMSLFMIIAFLYTTTFFEFIPWYKAYGLRETLAVLGIVAAVLLVSYPGIELSEARGRAFWNGSGLVPLFLVNGLSSGIAGLILTSVILGKAHEPVVLLMSGGIWFGVLFANLVLLNAYLLGVRNIGAEEAERALSLILRGELKTRFFLGAVTCGILLPLVIYIFGNNPALLAVKAVLVLIGSACFRGVVLQAGVRRAIPGEENELISAQEEAELGCRLERRWKEKEVWLYGAK